MRPSKLGWIVFGLLGAGIAGCVIHTGPRHHGGFSARYHDTRWKRLAADGAGILEIHGINGAVAVAGTDEESILVKAQISSRHRKDLAKISASARREGNAIVLDAVIPEGISGAVGYDITLPRRMRVKIVTDNAPVTVARAAGVDAVTGNAPVTVERIDGDVSATTNNGDIALSEINGAVTAQTSDAGIKAEEVHSPAAIHLSTNNGRVEAHDLRGTVEIRSTNGDVALEPGEVTGPITVTTTNARITVNALPETGAVVSGVTTNGKVHVAGREVRSGETVTLGKGGPDIRLTTSNAGITVETDGTHAKPSADTEKKDSSGKDSDDFGAT